MQSTAPRVSRTTYDEMGIPPVARGAFHATVGRAVTGSADAVTYIGALGARAGNTEDVGLVAHPTAVFAVTAIW